MNKKYFGFIIVAILVAIFIFININNEEYKTTQIVMDTVVDVDVSGKNAKATGQEIISRLTDIENQISMYKTNSEITRINNSAGKQYEKVSKETYNILKTSVDYSKKSDGKFDITIAPLILAWDIKAENPVIPQITQDLIELVNYNDIIFGEQNTVMLKNENQKIDLGGIAKGYAADIAYNILESSNCKSAIISIGGNIVLYGKNTKELSVGIKHPRQDGLIAKASSDKKIIATTGDYERYFEIDGARYHHIIDKSTGYPHNGDFFSVTVFCNDGAMGDYLSTYLYMISKEELVELLENEDYYIFAVGRDNIIYKSSNLNITVLDDNFKVK